MVIIGDVVVVCHMAFDVMLVVYMGPWRASYVARPVCEEQAVILYNVLLRGTALIARVCEEEKIVKITEKQIFEKSAREERVLVA